MALLTYHSIASSRRRRRSARHPTFYRFYYFSALLCSGVAALVFSFLSSIQSSFIHFINNFGVFTSCEIKDKVLCFVNKMETRKESLSALKVCRFCLTHNESLSSLYEKSKAPKNSVTLTTKIMSCVAIEVNKLSYF